MKPFIRHAEKWRITLVLFIAVLGGLLTNAWVVSLAVSLAGYVIWIHFKLQ